MTDDVQAHDYVNDAVALVRLLNAGRTADAQQLLGSYTTAEEHGGLTGTMVNIATLLSAYLDRVAHDLATAKPEHLIGSSDDVLTQFQVFMSKPDGSKASDNNSRAEPISYL
jgi:hypothetical protein